MSLLPEPPPPPTSAHKTPLTPFPPHKPPDPFFPPKFSWDDAAFRPETFLDSFESDYGGRQLELRNKVVENLKGPLTFQHQCQFQTWNQTVARGVTPIHFRSAVSLVIAALDRGYYPNPTNKAEPLLSTEEWAELACSVIGATGRGYARPHSEDKTDFLNIARATSRDVTTEGSNLTFDTLFHRLGATAEALQTYVEGDDQVAGWLPEVEEDTIELLRYLATRHVEEALATWESLEVSRQANLMLPDLPQQAHEANLVKIQNIAAELGYELTPKTNAQATGTATEPATVPAAVPRPPSRPHRVDRPLPHPPNMDMNTFTAALQAAMKPLLSRIEAVERASLRPPAATDQHTRAVTTPDTPRAAPTPRTTQTVQPNECWTTVTNKRKRKKGGKKPDEANQPFQQIILTPRSYAAAAAAPPHK
ncbi:hypothetical protein F5888DRAFT_1705350 [Russula emetica]|nr:hypothetical protein F5888DRAFT_1705350 [Russula emetica]